MKPLRIQDWAVYLQPPPSTHASAENLLKYLARYVTGGPISNGRLISHENGQVTFWARDKSKTGNRVPVRLSGAEFVRRWSLHILPSGLHRVRYYGGLHPSKRKAYQELCRRLLGEPPAGEQCQDESNEMDPPAEMALRHDKLQQGICPDCGGRLDVIWSRIERPSWADVLNSPSAPAWYLGNRL